MTTLIKASCTSFLLPLILLLSGCLETMQPLTAKSSSNQNAVVQEKSQVPTERASTSVMRTSQPESKPVVVRTNAQGLEVQPANKPIDGATSTKPQSSSFSKGKEITCTPNVVRPGDTLIIKTNKAYPDFGVRVPDRNVKFILLVSSGYPEGLMDSDKFGKQLGININVTEVKIKPSTRVFTKEGVYGFVVSRSLETDDGTPSFECKVSYKAK